MKKKAGIFCVLIALMFSVSSCGKEQYSCDPTADQWVKANLSEIKTMTRSGWLELDQNQSVKKAVFRAFDSDMQQKFWEDKISEVINQFDWNEQEVAHLNALLEYLRTSDLFSKEEADEEFELFTYRWSDYAKNELKWSPKLIYGIAGSGARLLNKDGDVIQARNNTQISTMSMVKASTEEDYIWDCGCSQASDFCNFEEIMPMWCGQFYDLYCRRLPYGCGIFFKLQCDGVCIGNYY